MRRSKGYTIIETMVAVGIIGISGALAYPVYSSHVDKMKIAESRKDLVLTDLKIETYFATNGAFPPDLAAIGMQQDDPWGKTYFYYNRDIPSGNGRERMDVNGTKINTDYDLYSKGPDNISAGKVSHSNGLDDIVRGNNGDFIGAGADY
jgi:general secretion pathway protein G